MSEPLTPPPPPPPGNPPPPSGNPPGYPPGNPPPTGTGGPGGPGGYGAPPPVGPGGARRLVEPYAITLLVLGVLGVIAALLGVVSNLFGFAGDWTDMADLSQLDPEMRRWVEMGSQGGGAVAVAWSFLGLAAYGFVIWAALRMRQLEGWTPAVIATVLVMVPFHCCCCLLGIPIGIWGLVVLLKPDVKASFVS